MTNQKLKHKTREWAKRYIPAEILGTLGALCAALLAFTHTHSYAAAAAAGWVAEGLGFYGYFVTAELITSHHQHRRHSLLRRIPRIIAGASTNLLVEFAPAELLDNFFFRPFAMYLAPQHIHPYAAGFLVGKFSADALFYALAIVGYEARKRWLPRPGRRL